jgi:hypothetical protein
MNPVSSEIMRCVHPVLDAARTAACITDAVDCAVMGLVTAD